MDRAILSELNEERRARRAVMLVTGLADGTVRILREGEAPAPDLAEPVANAFRTGRSASVETAAGTVFLNVHLPPPRLVVIGAVHISQALAPMAKIAGFDVEIIDPRTAFATAERFPDATLHAQWPQDALAHSPLDPFCAVAAVTHDPKIDDPALEAALAASCFYVGALGSRKTHARRVERLLAAGLPQEAIDRIAAPIGLDIRASTPAEIAVAVLAPGVRARRTRGRAGAA